jgi:chemotaxis methyl-accepting protein methylase
MSESRSSIARPVLDQVIAVVRARRGLDFHGYRRGTLERRLLYRMARLGARTDESYLRILQDRDEEADRLIEQFTVKVSWFYRNAAVFGILRDCVIPDLRSRYPDERLRIWSAGCGHGEEPYTLAMLVAGTPASIWASDVDPSAIDAAGRARYPATAFRELPVELSARFLEPATGSSLQIRREVRDRVRFVRHDLTAASVAPGEPPYHLVCCRNVAIYLDLPLQRRAFELVARSLVPGGVLCLGESEWLPHPALGMDVIDRKTKLFRKAKGVHVQGTGRC